LTLVLYLKRGLLQRDTVSEFNVTICNESLYFSSFDLSQSIQMHPTRFFCLSSPLVNVGTVVRYHETSIQRLFVIRHPPMHLLRGATQTNIRFNLCRLRARTRVYWSLLIAVLAFIRHVDANPDPSQVVNTVSYSRYPARLNQYMTLCLSVDTRSSLLSLVPMAVRNVCWLRVVHDQQKCHPHHLILLASSNGQLPGPP
jgi:hypothetical protein